MICQFLKINTVETKRDQLLNTVRFRVRKGETIRYKAPARDWCRGGGGWAPANEPCVVCDSDKRCLYLERKDVAFNLHSLPKSNLEACVLQAFQTFEMKL